MRPFAATSRAKQETHAVSPARACTYDGENFGTYDIVITDNTAVFAVAAAIVLCSLLAAFFLLRRRGAGAEAHPEDGRFEGPAQFLEQDNEGEALSVSLVPGRLTIGMVNATLAYRLEIANRGRQHIVGLRLSADMVSPRSSGEEDGLRHLAMGPDMGRAALQTFTQIDPGTTVSAESSVELPLGMVDEIREGGAPVLLPFVRMRAVGAGTPPRRFSFAVGLPAGEEGGRLMPIRLDEGPRVLRHLSARLVA